MQFPSFRQLLRAFAAASAALVPLLAAAAGLLEVPAQGSSQSGIGVISGWHCSGARIEVSIDLGPPVLVSSHTPREDTASTCGRSDTGFAMPFNWNILQPTFCCEIGYPTSHRVTAFADGVQFADVTFQTGGFWTEFLTGKSGTYLLRNFPHGENHVSLTWDEASQNFVITRGSQQFRVKDQTSELGGSGTYFGAVNITAGSSCPSDPTPSVAQTRYGKFIVTTTNGQMQLRAEYADGGICQLPVIPVSPERPLMDGRVKATFNAADVRACPEFGGGALEVTANGKNLDARTLSACKPAKLSAASVDPS